jgi:transposase
MRHYVGLDVSLRKTSLCFVNEPGELVREGEIAAEAKEIASWLRGDRLRVTTSFSLSASYWDC